MRACILTKSHPIKKEGAAFLQLVSQAEGNGAEAAAMESHGHKSIVRDMHTSSPSLTFDGSEV